MKQRTRWQNISRIGVALIVLSLSACGFHLRGALPLAQPLQHLYIQAADPYGTLVKELEQSLKMSHVTLATNANEADTILVIAHDDTSQTQLSVSGTTQTRQFRLAVTVIFSLTDSHGATIIPAEAITESRIITIQSNQILGSSNQANLYYQQMRSALASAIMFRLSSHQVTEAVKTAFHTNQPAAKFKQISKKPTL